MIVRVKVLLTIITLIITPMLLIIPILPGLMRPEMALLLSHGHEPDRHMLKAFKASIYIYIYIYTP